MNSAELSDMLDLPASEHEEAVRPLSTVDADTQFGGEAVATAA